MDAREALDATYTDGFLVHPARRDRLRALPKRAHPGRHAPPDVGLEVDHRDRRRHPGRARGCSTRSRSSPPCFPSLRARPGRARRCGTCWTCAPGRGSTRSTPTRRPTCGSTSRSTCGGRRSTPGCRRTRATYMAGLENDRPHGGAFDYRSVLTDMLGWVVERCGGARLAALVARELWGPMGAEFDAEVTVDGARQRDGRRRRLRHAARPRPVRAAVARGRRVDGRGSSPRRGSRTRWPAARTAARPSSGRTTPPPIRAASTATSGG